MSQATRRCALLLSLVLIGACATAPPPPPQPEADSGQQAKPGWRFERQAVVAAHPLAAEAGAALLRAGGNAVDAAVATQLVLGLVEPQSSGLGGGGFLLLWDGKRLLGYDGRETAPAAAGESLFLRADGSPLPREQATRSGLAVGVPGLLRLLESVHRDHGRLPWARLFEPAIAIADRGFPMGQRLQTLLLVDPILRSEPAAAARFYDASGQPLPLGTLLRNPAQAEILRRVAREGADAFYQGAVADDLLKRVQQSPRPGAMTAADLRAYRVERRDPICSDWRGWRLCGLPPPSAGFLMTAQVLALLEPLPELQQAEGLHRYAEAARLAGADRDMHLADPRFVAAPAGRWSSLLDPAYLALRRQLIGPKAAASVSAGQPAGSLALWAPQDATVESGTTHFSVVDAQGMALAFTSSVEAAFGNRMLADGGTGLAGGFFLNNQLTDFAFQPRDPQGRPVANRVEGGKRPRSSMNPMLVFDANGRLEMVLGSPGGLAIPHYTARLLLQTLGHDEALQPAIGAPNLALAGDTVLIEPGFVDAASLADVRARGHRVRELPLTSGLHVLRRQGGGWLAGADPRREGIAAGD